MWAIVAWSRPANACPICDSETGVEVRSHIVGGELVTNLAVTVAPFILTVAFIAGAHYAFTDRGRE